MSHGPHDITCRELVELVSNYLEGALPGDDRERFEAHLAVCDPCLEYIEQIRETGKLASRIDEEALDPEVREHLLVAFKGWTAA